MTRGTCADHPVSQPRASTGRRFQGQLDEPRRQHPDIDGPLGPVVGVERRECFVQLTYEGAAVARRRPELDQPVVPPARLARRCVARRHGELRGLGAGSTARTTSARSISSMITFSPKALTKWRVRPVITRRSGSRAVKRRPCRRAGRTRGRPESSAPPRTRGRARCRPPCGVAASPARDPRADELVEDAVVEHERQPAGALGLERDEALGGG